MANRTYAMGALLMLLACSTVLQENTGTSNEKLGTLTNVENGSTTMTDINLSGTWSTFIGSAPVTNWDVAFDDESDTVSSTIAHFGWAFAPTNSGTYTRCYDGSASCNSGVAIDKTNLPNFVHWGDQNGVFEPGLVSDGAMNVAYVAVYTTSTPDTQIAIVGSHDGGASFGVATNQVRSVTADSGGAGQGCNTGPSRSPTIAVDMTTANAVFPNAPTLTPTFWVAWGHNGAGTFGGCVRTYQFDSSGNLSAAGAAMAGYTIDNMAPEAFGDSQGALIIQANDGMATVVYSDQDHVPNTTADCGNNTSIGWGAVSTTNGDDWTDHSEVFHATNFAWCTVTDGSAFPGNPKVIKGRREFDFIIAPDGNSYVAVNDAANSIRLFMSTTRGVKVPGMGAPSDSPWREFCPSNTSNWSDPGIHPCLTGWFPGEDNNPPAEVFRPTLSADGNSGVALMWYQTVQLPSAGPPKFGVETQQEFADLPRLFNNSYQSGGGGPTTIENGFDPNPGGTTFNLHTTLGLYNTMPASRAPTASCAGSSSNDIQPYWSFVNSTPMQVIDTIATP